MKRLLLIALLIALAPAAVAQDKAFVDAWPQIRQALLDNDIAFLTRMTAPTITLLGDLDDSPKHKLDRSKLAQLLPLVMAEEQTELVDANIGKVATVTNRQRFEKINLVKGKETGLYYGISDEGATVGPFGFDRTATGWQLSTVYLSDDSKAKLGFNPS